MKTKIFTNPAISYQWDACFLIHFIPWEIACLLGKIGRSKYTHINMEGNVSLYVCIILLILANLLRKIGRSEYIMFRRNIMLMLECLVSNPLRKLMFHQDYIDLRSLLQFKMKKHHIKTWKISHTYLHIYVYIWWKANWLVWDAKRRWSRETAQQKAPILCSECFESSLLFETSLS